MSIRSRLLLSLLVVGVAFGLVATFVFRDLGAAQQRTETMRRESLEPVMHLRRLKAASDERVNWGTLIRYEPTFNRADALKGLEESSAVFTAELEAIKTLNLPDRIKENMVEIIRITGGLVKFSNHALGTNMVNPDPSAPELTFDQQGPATNRRTALINENVTIMETKQRDQEQALNDTYQTARNDLVIGLAVALGVAVVVALVTASWIVRPVRRTVKVLESVADGDLTPRMPTGRDEIGQMGDALNKTLDQVGGVVRSIDESAKQLGDRSTALTSRSYDLATAAASVASDANDASVGVHVVSNEVADVATTTVELTKVVDHLARNARDAAEAARRALAVVSTIGQSAGSRADVAAFDELARLLGRIGDIQARTAAAIDAQSDLGGRIHSAVANLTSSSGSVDEHVNGVAAAVELTSQVVEDTSSEAEDLADLSALLETLTSVFQYERALPPT